MTINRPSTYVTVGQTHKIGNKAWFPYDRWRSFTIAEIASKVFSDRHNHMETKFSFCQRSPMIPATANDRSDHDRQRSSARSSV